MRRPTFEGGILVRLLVALQFFSFYFQVRFIPHRNFFFITGLYNSLKVWVITHHLFEVRKRVASHSVKCTSNSFFKLLAHFHEYFIMKFYLSCIYRCNFLTSNFYIDYSCLRRVFVPIFYKQGPQPVLV